MSYGKLRNLVADINVREGSIHVPIASAGRADGPPGQAATIEASGSLAYIKFDGAAGAQKVYRTYKIPGSYRSNPSIHIHWTKTTNADTSNQNVRWTVNYEVFNGRNQDAVSTPTTVHLDDTYTDAGTTTRVVHRTENQSLDGIVANYYVAISIEKGIHPSGSLVTDPAIVTLDMIYDSYLNQ